MYDLHKFYQIPKEYISCPGCNKLYATKKVCVNCQECKSCCMCEEKEFVSGKFYIENILGYNP